MESASERGETILMGELRDKARNKAQEVKGNVKEGVGRATDNRSLQAKGHTDQAKAKTKGFGERIKDLFR